MDTLLKRPVGRRHNELRRGSYSSFSYQAKKLGTSPAVSVAKVSGTPG